MPTRKQQQNAYQPKSQTVKNKRDKVKTESLSNKWNPNNVNDQKLKKESSELINA